MSEVFLACWLSVVQEKQNIAYQPVEAGSGAEGLPRVITVVLMLLKDQYLKYVDKLKITKGKN